MCVQYACSVAHLVVGPVVERDYLGVYATWRGVPLAYISLRFLNRAVIDISLPFRGRLYVGRREVTEIRQSLPPLPHHVPPP